MCKCACAQRTNQHGNILKNGCTMCVHNSKQEGARERKSEQILENISCSMAKDWETVRTRDRRVEKERDRQKASERALERHTLEVEKKKKIG